MAPSETVEFRILGPFEVLHDGRRVPIGPGQERALLAALLLSRNERVSTDRLIDLLWGASPPHSASKMIQIYVSRLRRALGSADRDDPRLVTEPSGYRLRVDSDELDLDRFERLSARGRKSIAGGNPARGASELREALDLWHGIPLSDLAEADFVERERIRLEELRLTALEERLEAELALGEGPALLDELNALVRDHPLRERPAAQLMLALYRSGRQAEALALYKKTRDRLVDELGIEPGPQLRRLEQAILQQDSALEPPAEEPGIQPRTRLVPPRSQRVSRRSGVAIAIALVIAAVAIVVASFTGGGQRRVVLSADAIGIVSDGHLADQAPVDVSPSAIAAGAGGIWITSAGANSVLRVDPKTLAIRQTIIVGSGPSGVTVGGGAAW